MINDEEMRAYFAIRWSLVSQSEINSAEKNWSNVIGRHNSHRDNLVAGARTIGGTAKIEPVHHKKDKSKRGKEMQAGLLATLTLCGIIESPH